MSKPVFLLGASPDTEIRLRDFYDDGPNTVVDMLRNPGQVRHSGWDLRTYDEPRVEKASYLEVGRSDHKLIRLYPDGTLALRGAGDDDLLTWATRKSGLKGLLRVNPVVLAELSYSFVLFYSRLHSFFDREPQYIQFQIGLRNAISDEGTRLCVVPAEVNTWGFESPRHGELHEAPGKEMDENVKALWDDVKTSPEAVSYGVVEAFYLWFGVKTDRIPYVRKNGKREIDIEKIASL